MFTNRRARLQTIKADTEHSEELIEIMQKIVDNERQKDNTPEIDEKLTELEMHLGAHRITVCENKALIARLEQPFWKFW